MKNKITFSIVVLFFLSGMTSLAFQSIWVRTISLAIGSTSESISIVLTIFFAGLALGSLLSGRYGRLTQRPLYVYGLLEGAIGLYGVAAYFILANFYRVMALVPLGGAFSYLGLIFKFVCIAIVLLPPTIMMGSTLPLLTKLVGDLKAKQRGQLISLMYGINTLGASCGALATGFLWVPQWGVTWTNLAMCAVNLVIAAAAIVLTKHLPQQQAVTDAPCANNPERYRLSEKRNSIPDWLFLVLTFACGFSSIGAEVIWSKYLSIFLGSNIFGLSVVLWVYLFGMAIGSLALAFLLKVVENRDRLLLILLFGTVLSIMGISLVVDKVPIIAAVTAYFLNSSLSLFAIKIIWVMLFLLVPTSFYGMLFPLIIHQLSHHKKHAYADVGKAYSSNTLGAIVGSSLSGLFLIPEFGSAVAMQVSILSLLIAVAVYCFYVSKNQSIRFSLIAMNLLIGFGVIAFRQLSFENIIRSAYLTSINEKSTLAEVLHLFESDQEKFKLIVEGKGAVISLSQTKQDGDYYQRYLRLKTNGLNESIYSFENPGALPKYEGLLGLVPFAFSQNTERAFLVGYGGGFSADLLSSLPIKNVDIVELEAGILKAADYVYKGKNPILSRNNVKLRIDDARYILTAKKDQKYDIVMSQPSHSWLAGVANLFTVEFFTMVKSNLAPGGVYSQWLNLYNMDEEVLHSILKTFYSVFPHGAVFSDPGDQEMILIGSMQPLRFKHERIKQVLQNEEFKKKLMFLPVNTSYDLASLLLTDRSEVVQASQGATINSDYNAYAEVRQSRLFYSKSKHEARLNEMLTKHSENTYRHLDKVDFFEDAPLSVYNLLVSLMNRGSFQKFYALLPVLEQQNAGHDPGAEKRLGYIMFLSQRYHTAQNYLRSSLTRMPDPEALNHYLATFQAQGRYGEIVQAVKEFTAAKNDASDCYELFAQLNLGQSTASVSDLANKMLEAQGRYRASCGPILDLSLGYYFYLERKYESSAAFLSQYLEKYPQDVAILKILASNYLILGDNSKFSDVAAKIGGALRDTETRLQNLASYYRLNHLDQDAALIDAMIRRLK